MVEKYLDYRPQRYNLIAVVIEESKDLNSFSTHELMDSINGAFGLCEFNHFTVKVKGMKNFHIFGIYMNHAKWVVLL